MLVEVVTVAPIPYFKTSLYITVTLCIGFDRCCMITVTLTALRDNDKVCRMSSMVFSTRPLHNRCGNLTGAAVTGQSGQEPQQEQHEVEHKGQI